MKNNREINCTYQNCCGSCSHSLRACVIPNNVKILHGKNSRTKKQEERRNIYMASRWNTRVRLQADTNTKMHSITAERKNDKRILR